MAKNRRSGSRNKIELVWAIPVPRVTAEGQPVIVEKEFHNGLPRNFFRLRPKAEDYLVEVMAEWIVGTMIDERKEEATKRVKEAKRKQALKAKQLSQFDSVTAESGRQDFNRGEGPS